MTILAIDPGHEESAFVYYDGKRPINFGKTPNDVLLAAISSLDFQPIVVIESIASYGMSVGAEVFETVHWAGRFYEAELRQGCEVHRMPRMKVKMHLCHDSRAKDSNIRQALIDRFGPGKDAAIGRKATPGPLYGVSNDVWAALAIAVTFADTYCPVTELSEVTN